MELITPNVGLIFWTTSIFLIVLIVLRLFAWKPVLNAIRTRENTINAALSAAEKAKAEIVKLEAKNEKIMQKARAERESMIREASEMKESIIAEAREKASAEAARIFEASRLNIENERLMVMAQLKEQVAQFSVEIAEKILREKLSDEKAQHDLIGRLLDEIKLN